jgi:hypothetical protein
MQLTTQATPIQSSKLLLVIASTGILGFGFQRDPWPNFFSFQDCLCVRKWGLLFNEKKGLSFCVCAKLVTVISQECTRTHIASRYFMDTTHALSLDCNGKDLCRIYVIAGFCSILCLNLLTNLERQLVTWRAADLTTAKFKPLMLPMHGFSLSSSRTLDLDNSGWLPLFTA